MKFFLFFSLLISSTAYSAYTVQEGKLVKTETVPTQSVQEHYSAALEAHEKQNWPELLRQTAVVLKNFPKTPFAQESLFYSAVAYFQTQELETADRQLSSYLKSSQTPKFFEEAISLKYSIAESFQKGAKKHLLGLKFMPRWVPATEEAFQIYEEVIAALPHHEVAAKALFKKGALYFKTHEYKSSVEAFQTLIRRFPKHELSPESYVSIGEVYLTQSQEEYPDPDLLDLASINLRKFRADFPSDHRTQTAASLFLDMQEVYAQNLFETGKFFEKTKKEKAAKIYYNKIVLSFPETKTAALCEKKLSQMHTEEGL